MGFIKDLLAAISSEKADCPWCGETMRGDGGRFECPKCVGGVFFMVNGELTDFWHRGTADPGSCDACGSSLAGAVCTSEWEDGDNASAYVTCPQCGAENYI